MPPQSCLARVEAFKRNMFRVGEVRVMRTPSAQVEGTVSATGANTFFGKTASMIQVRHLVGGDGTALHDAAAAADQSTWGL